jgi:hypothetical protein
MNQMNQPLPEPMSVEKPSVEASTDPSQNRSESGVLPDSMLSESLITEATTIPLLEERLRVKYQRRKVGEVIVRKQIETRMVSVPIRHEKLIIEQVGDIPKQLAEVRLGEGVTETDDRVVLTGNAIIRGEFDSPRVASQVLYELGKTLHTDVYKVRVEIELANASLEQSGQAWLDHFIQVSQS